MFEMPDRLTRSGVHLVFVSSDPTLFLIGNQLGVEWISW